MPFDHYNNLGSWQYFTYSTLFDFLHCFVQVYLNDIFIHNKTL